ncbi:hypothetical protein WISP_00332 [Willisornis vidua]|uniref:Uncharacterized protein n=1 Tax=Willisornis vidua TaxID=1566151 RepID=A0ABQ9E1E7_9PASS|nr:hypothetical protein WISP_00332 [Willisornis vidua]
MPKRINDDPDPNNLKASIVSLLSVNSMLNLNLLDQFINSTFRSQPDRSISKHIDPVSVVLTKAAANSYGSLNYRAAVDYFMLTRMIGCSEKPGLCCLEFSNLQKKTQFAFYNVAELKNLSAAQAPANFYSKDIFESIQIPFMPNWLKQVVLICLSSAFTYSLSLAKNSIIKRVFSSKIQNNKGGDVGDGEYMDMREWRRARDRKTDFDIWKVQEDPSQAGQ